MGSTLCKFTCSEKALGGLRQKNMKNHMERIWKICSNIWQTMQLTKTMTISTAMMNQIVTKAISELSVQSWPLSNRWVLTQTSSWIKSAISLSKLSSVLGHVCYTCSGLPSPRTLKTKWYLKCLGLMCFWIKIADRIFWRWIIVRALRQTQGWIINLRKSW